jgi:hypothetical protein
LSYGEFGQLLLGKALEIASMFPISFDGQTVLTIDGTPSTAVGGDSDPLYRNCSCRMAVFPVPLSLRIVEDVPAARGTLVTHQTVRMWCEKFGRRFANVIRRRSGALRDKWHLDDPSTIANLFHIPATILPHPTIANSESAP